MEWNTDEADFADYHGFDLKIHGNLIILKIIVQKEKADCPKFIHHPALIKSDSNVHTSLAERWITILPLSIVRPLIHLIPAQAISQSGQARTQQHKNHSVIIRRICVIRVPFPMSFKPNIRIFKT
jgi:hypothetical protein